MMQGFNDGFGDGFGYYNTFPGKAGGRSFNRPSPMGSRGARGAGGRGGQRFGGDGKNKRGEYERKVYVGNMSKTTKSAAIKETFEQYGTVEDAFCIKDKKGNRKGFGFVKFSDSAGVDSTMNARPISMKDEEGETRELVVRRCLNPDKPENSFTSSILFVGGIKDEHTPEVLEEYFSKYGNLEKVDIGKDKDGKPRKFAKVTFDDFDAVDKVLTQYSHKPAGEFVRCKKFLGKEDMEKLEQKQQRTAQYEQRQMMNAVMGGGGGMMGGRGGGRSMQQNTDFAMFQSMANGMGFGGGGDGYGSYNRSEGRQSQDSLGPAASKLGGTERKFLGLLKEANVTDECLKIMLKENLLNPDVLVALSAADFGRIPIAMGDRTRLQLVLTSLGYGR